MSVILVPVITSPCCIRHSACWRLPRDGSKIIRTVVDCFSVALVAAFTIHTVSRATG